ncbi:hypothetical protein VP01_768g1 [Puccinia sorghi]|uniref:Uncharacterized protein n=1 Tax=Puccinia sorghi TaxID=27349 RepID=A0A0L6UCH2_9BASI|nr:hypothetical protein VP01_768g1 [Puccinia sorghi]
MKVSVVGMVFHAFAKKKQCSFHLMKEKPKFWYLQASLFLFLNISTKFCWRWCVLGVVDDRCMTDGKVQIAQPSPVRNLVAPQKHVFSLTAVYRATSQCATSKDCVTWWFSEGRSRENTRGLHPIRTRKPETGLKQRPERPFHELHSLWHLDLPSIPPPAHSRTVLERESKIFSIQIFKVNKCLTPMWLDAIDVLNTHKQKKPVFQQLLQRAFNQDMMSHCSQFQGDEKMQPSSTVAFLTPAQHLLNPHSTMSNLLFLGQSIIPLHCPTPSSLPKFQQPAFLQRGTHQLHVWCSPRCQLFGDLDQLESEFIGPLLEINFIDEQIFFQSLQPTCLTTLKHHQIQPLAVSVALACKCYHFNFLNNLLVTSATLV